MLNVVTDYIGNFVSIALFEFSHFSLVLIFSANDLKLSRLTSYLNIYLSLKWFTLQLIFNESCERLMQVFIEAYSLLKLIERQRR